MNEEKDAVVFEPGVILDVTIPTDDTTVNSDNQGNEFS